MEQSLHYKLPDIEAMEKEELGADENDPRKAHEEGGGLRRGGEQYVDRGQSAVCDQVMIE